MLGFIDFKFLPVCQNGHTNPKRNTPKGNTAIERDRKPRRAGGFYHGGEGKKGSELPPSFCFMLAQKYRIRTQEEWNLVFKKGKPFHSRMMLLKVMPNRKPYSRMGVSVSTKVDKKATVRNTIKRRLRAIFAGIHERLRAGHDCIIIARQPIKEKTYKDIESELYHLLSAARILKKVR